MKLRVASIVTGLMLAACGGGEGRETAGDARGEALAGSMTEAVEKAKAVEEQAAEHKRAIDDALERAEDDHRP